MFRLCVCQRNKSEKCNISNGKLLLFWFIALKRNVLVVPFLFHRVKFNNIGWFLCCRVCEACFFIQNQFYQFQFFHILDANLFFFGTSREENHKSVYSRSATKLRRKRTWIIALHFLLFKYVPSIFCYVSFFFLILASIIVVAKYLFWIKNRNRNTI